MRREFTHHRVNEVGQTKLVAIGEGFSRLLDELESLAPEGREMALVRTKLQEACNWARRAVAAHAVNQEPTP